MKTDPTDPRCGMPSASGMERLMLCPGSWQLAQKCEPLPETQAQKDGTRLHKAMELHDLSKLYDPEEIAACEWCRQMATELATDTFPYDDAESWEAHRVIREKRLWNNEQTFSGQADILYLAGKKALVIDYKFGRGEVAEVQDNAQLMALAVLVADNYPQVEEVYCAILQPFASRKVPPTVRYTREDLAKARKMLLDAVYVATELRAGKPQLIPGARQCQYCPAAQACPHMSSSLALMAGATAQSAELMSPQVLADRLAMWKVVKSFGEQLEAVAKARLKCGLDVPGYALTEGRRVFKVTNAAAAFERMNEDICVLGDDFAECCTVSVGKLECLLYKLRKEMDESATLAAAKVDLRSMLEKRGAGEWVQQEGSLVERRGE